MSGRYRPYQSLRETLADLYRKAKQLPKTVKTPKFVESVILDNMSVPEFSQNLAAGILMDEEDYGHDHCRIYFPADSELLHMLWKAKMDVSLADIAEFPRAFSIAWPDDFEMEGFKFPGCLIWWGTEREKKALHTRFGNKYLDGNFIPWNPKGRLNDDQRLMSLSYQLADTPDSFPASYRCLVPDDKLALCLKSPEDMEASIGQLAALMSIKLTPAEHRQQFIMLKLAVHLMVYATACPQAIVHGWPDKFKAHDAGKGWIKDFTPIKLASPVRHRIGSSPETHWRTWHFRQYPVKKDGSRQKGLVFVSGCIVNADVDPKTVIQV